MDRRAFMAATGGLLAIPLAAPAQQPSARHPATRVYRVGFLGAETANEAAWQLEILRSGLHERGYVEGRNTLIVVRLADGHYDRLPRLAAELVRLKIDVLVASGSKAGLAAKSATATIPVVVNNMGDAVKAGFAGSLGKPAGNVTGVSMMNPEATVKQLALLREIKPRLARVAVLMNPANPNYALTLEALRREGFPSKLRIEPFDVRRGDELERAFKAIAKAGVDGMLVQSETLFAARAQSIANLAIKHRIAAAGTITFGQAGGLIGYSAYTRDAWRHVVVYVDRILRGAKPAELPIERPTKFGLIVNAKTARALGLTIPQSVLLRADEVIR